MGQRLGFPQGAVNYIQPGNWKKAAHSVIKRWETKPLSIMPCARSAGATELP